MDCRRGEQLDQIEPFYPLRVGLRRLLPRAGAMRYRRSAHGQRIPVFSSSSESWLEHARRYTDRAIEEFRLTPAQRVVEIGSNDGYLLQYFVQRGIPVLGVDAGGQCRGSRDRPRRSTRIEALRSRDRPRCARKGYRPTC